MTNKIGSIVALKLLYSNTIFRAGRIIFQVFLNIFIWDQTGDIKVVALFNVFFLSFHMLFFYLAAFWVKRGWRRSVSFIGIGGYIFTYLLLFFLEEKSLNYIYVIGALLGVFSGLYWINYNVTQFELTTFKNRGNFEGIKKSLRIISKMSVPLIVGLIIEYMGYSGGFLFGVLLFVISMYLGDVKKEYDVGRLKLVEFIKISSKNSELIFLYFSSVLTTFAMSMIMIELLIPLLMFNTMESELKVGAGLSLLTFISAVIIYIFGKWVDYKKYNIALLLFGLGYIFSLLGLVYSTDFSLVLIYFALITVFLHLYSLPFSVIANNVLHTVKNYNDYKVEFNLVREFCYYFGWIVGFALMYFSETITIEGMKRVFYAMIVATFFSIVFTIKTRMDILDDNK